MKNPFDPINNFDEWIQNDWESDDFIENQNRSQLPEQDPGTGATIAALIIVIGVILAVIFGLKACIFS
ncbi:MAG: hypothetical protein IKG70_04535 [Lachnospiraceae bacterium]|nr:hypothetical protein [Lachnospiraceae bacterium]